MASPSVKYLIIVPAYNAGKYLPELILRIKQAAPASDILIINDGSLDNTFEIINNLKLPHIDNPNNRGKGCALKGGFEYGIDNNYDYIITIDADLQHRPEDIPRFIEKAGTASIVIGTREISSRTMSLARYISNTMTSAIVSRFCGQRIRDSQSGFKMYSTELIKKMDIGSEKFDFETELLIQAGREKAKIAEIPIMTIHSGSSSNINHLADTWRFIKLVWKYALGNKRIRGEA